MYIECDREIKTNIELLIRHGCFLEVRNTVWYVPTSSVTEPLIGRPTLEALGLNSKEILEAAVGKLGTTVDMEILSPSKFKEGTIARVINDGLYHSEKLHLEDVMDKDEWLDLEIDAPEEINEAITSAVTAAEHNVMSIAGTSKLQDLLNTHRDTLLIRLGNDPPAQVEPMRVEIKTGSTPIACCLLYTSPSPRDQRGSRMPSSA